MNNIILDTIFRGIVIFILALALTRLMGRKLISQMTFFDFVVGVSMGSIIANAIIGPQNTSLSAIIALLVLSLLAILVGYLNIKSLKVRKLANSEPVVMVNNGILIEENMRKIRITINDLMMKLRDKNAFSLADVEYAIMETDGKLSVLLKSDKQPLNPSHMKIQTTSSGLMRDIIIDGIVMEENLTKAGLDRTWLNNQLTNQNIRDVSEVFYAGTNNNNNLMVSRKNSKDIEVQGKYGIE